MFEIAFLKWNFRREWNLVSWDFLSFSAESNEKPRNIDGRSASQGDYWMGMEMLQINAIGEQKPNHAGAGRLLAVWF